MKKMSGIQKAVMILCFLAMPLMFRTEASAYPYHYIYPGETLTMEDLNLTNGTGSSKTWRSHSGLLSIEPIGLKQTRCKVTGVKAGGRADVTCTTKATSIGSTSEDVITHTFEFVVIEEPESIKLSRASKTLDLDEKLCLTPGDKTEITMDAVPSTSMFRSMRVTSSDEDVLTVSYDASSKKITLEAKKNGSAAVVIEGNYLDSSKTYQENCKLYVVVAPKAESITVNKSTKTIPLAERDNPVYGNDLIRVTPVPETAPLEEVTFTSSDPSVVKIVSAEWNHKFNSYNEQWSDNAYCTFYPLKSGTAVITATTAGGLKTSCRITVYAPEPSSVKIDSGDLSLSVGDTVQLKAQISPELAEPDGLTWTSSNPQSISIDQSGKLKVLALSDYYEYIEVKTRNGKTDRISVGIDPGIPDTVSLNKSKLNMTVGGTANLKLTLKPTPVSQYYWYWTSSAPKVVSVDENGNLKALKAGTATITVEVSSAKTASCTVTVAKKSSDAETKPTPVKKGTIIKHTASGGVYKVTAAGTAPKVTYVKPINAKKKSVTIPATIKENKITYQVTAISANAFKANKNITSVTIGKNVTSIGSSAFYGCKKLAKITLGKNVATIGSKAFGGCTAVTKVTLGQKVNKIGSKAFYGCTKLKSITLKSTGLTAKKVGSGAFGKTYSKASVKVPKGKAGAYKKILRAKGLSKKAKVS